MDEPASWARSYQLSEDRQVAHGLAQVARSTPATSAQPEAPSVGRITGLVDCRWADPATATSENGHVVLGRRYALASGFMEITYDSGAKVILQGPATYEVESASGGFLSLGKLNRGWRVKGPRFKVQDHLIPRPCFPSAAPPASSLLGPNG